MPMQATDPILAPSRGDVAAAIAFANARGAPPKAAAFLRAVWQYAAIAGVDASIVAIQSAHETADWTSVRFIRDTNPAGIGIPANDTPQPFPIRSADDAAKLHVQCLFAAATGDFHGGIALWPEAAEWFNRVWLAKVRHPKWPGVRTIGDLNKRYTVPGDQHATWAWDAEYTRKFVDKGNRIFADLTPRPVPNIGQPPEGPMPDTAFGRVQRPPIVDDIVNKPAGNGWSDNGPRQLRALVLHRVVGAARWTSGHFRNLNDPHGRNALTDWGVCGALDAELDGTILKWNDPDSRRSPWASGPAVSPTGQLLVNGDARTFYDRYAVNDPAGVSVFNRDTEAIELSGYYETPITAKQMDATCQLIAYRLDTKMQLPWNVWPKNQDGVQAILWHGEVNGWSKPCPGQVAKDATDEIIETVQAILKAAQTAGANVPPPNIGDPPTPPPDDAGPMPGTSWEMAARMWNPLQARDPDTGEVARFRKTGQVAKDWLAILRKEQTAPVLAVIIRCGKDGADGRRYLYTDGSFTDVAA